VLVELLREHIHEFGTAPDGRLFRTYRGATYLPSTLWQVLQKARRHAFTPAQVASPLARRPYDFRHAGVSWRLNAGTPAPLVAEWAGHTVEVLFRIYAHCIEGDDERWFARMEEALGGCPRQDSNLRSRLRRPVLFAAATWQNACWRMGVRSWLVRRGGSLVFPGDCQHGSGGRQAGGSILMV